MTFDTLRIDPAAIVELRLGEDIRLKLRSGRVLVWPGGRAKCLTIHDGEIERGATVTTGDCLYTETGDGVIFEGVKLPYHICPACGTGYRVGTKCSCQMKPDEHRHNAEAVKPN